MKTESKIRRILIAYPSITVEEIALMCGYENHGHGFCKMVSRVKSQIQERIISRKAIGG